MCRDLPFLHSVKSGYLLQLMWVEKVHNILTERSSGRPFGTSTALSFTCTLPRVTNWIREELSCGLREGGLCYVDSFYLYLNNLQLNLNVCDMVLTRLRISVLSKSFMSILKASSFNCGPRLQEIVIHALPGRSQSLSDRRRKENTVGKSKRMCVGE